MQSVNNNIYNINNSCKGTGFIPASYRPCPRCGGEGKGVLRDCRLCDDLCYVTTMPSMLWKWKTRTLR